MTIAKQKQAAAVFVSLSLRMGLFGFKSKPFDWASWLDWLGFDLMLELASDLALSGPVAQLVRAHA